MSPAAPWIETQIEDFRSGALSPTETIDLFAVLILNDAVSDEVRPAVDAAIADGHLSAAGDVLGYPDDGSARVYIEGTSLLRDNDDDGG